MDRGFALLDPLLGRPALVVEADHGPVRPSQSRDDETHAGEQLPEVMLDLGDDPPVAIRAGFCGPLCPFPSFPGRPLICCEVAEMPREIRWWPQRDSHPSVTLQVCGIVRVA